MCGGFPCNCCKPRLAIDTHFDDIDVPWKCFFRNKDDSGDYPSTDFFDFSRRQPATRPILDWPCAVSKLKVNATASGQSDPVLMATMKHPFDDPAVDPIDGYSYAVELTFVPDTSLQFHNLFVSVGEEVEGPRSYYGLTGADDLDFAREHFQIQLSREGSDSLDDPYPPFSFFPYNGVRIFFVVPNTTSTKNDRIWRSKLIADDLFGLTSSHTLRIEWSRQSDRYTVDVFLDGTRRKMRCVNAGSGTAGFGGTDPTIFQDTVQSELKSPRTDGTVDPLPWKNYRVGIQSRSRNNSSPFAITRDPLLYDRLIISGE